MIGTVLAAAAISSGLTDMTARRHPCRAAGRGRAGRLPAAALLLSAALAGCGDGSGDNPEAALLGVPADSPTHQHGTAPDAAAAAVDASTAGSRKTDGAPAAVPASLATLPPATDLMGPPRPGQSLDMKVVLLAEPLSITYPTQLPAIAAEATRLMIKVTEDQDLGWRNVARLDLFNSTPPGWAFRQRGFHRAMSVARPALCSHVVADSGYGTPEEAATDTLLRCHDYAAERGDALQVACQCQLAALNEALFLAPDQIDWRPSMPALILPRTGNRSTETGGFYGVLEMNRRPTTGEPVRVYGRDGGLVCRGRRRTNTDRGGRLRMTCFGSNETVQGDYRILGSYLGEPHGIAVVAGFQHRMIILFGLDGRSFDRRVRQIRADGTLAGMPLRAPPVNSVPPSSSPPPGVSPLPAGPAPSAADPPPIAPPSFDAPSSDSPAAGPGRAGAPDLPPSGFLENAVPLPPQPRAVEPLLPAAPADPDAAATATPLSFPAPVIATDPSTHAIPGTTAPAPAGPSDLSPPSQPGRGPPPSGGSDR